MGAENTILLRGSPIQDEALTDVETQPGFLLELKANGNVQETGSDDPYPERLVAVEMPEKGMDLNGTYAAGERVRYMACYPGCVVQVRTLQGQSFTVGARVGRGGNGRVKAGDDSKFVVGIALEDIASSATAQLLKVRIV